MTWQHSSSGSWDASASSWWSCNICGGWNWNTAKKCQKCGVKKSYAAVIKSGSQAEALPKPEGKIEELVSLLKAATAPQKSNDGFQQQIITACPGEDASSMDPNCRAEYSAQIKAVESALEQLPDTEVFSVARGTLMSQREELKKKIMNAKPLAARIEGCRGALERAQRRRQIALEALQLAQAAFKEADEAAILKETELTNMEAEYLSIAQQKLTADPDKENCLGALQKNMTRVLQEMEAGGTVDQSLITGAYTQMSCLFQGLTTISDQCKVQVQQAAPSPNGLATSAEDVGMASPPRLELSKNIRLGAELAGV